MKRFSLLALLATVLIAGHLPADDAPPATAPKVALDEKEQAFADLLNKSVMVGRFTFDRNGDDVAGDHDERYEIQSATKVSDHHWIVNSRIKYGKLDVVVPVPVEVHWADDTPVLCVTDLEIPLVGSEFTARVMFFDGRYAGTWRHGKVGGLMTGRIEHSDDEDKSATETEGAAKQNEP
jgi:hypothetical protein